MDVKEFEIPVPWGLIAVKAWGKENNLPVLLIHGLWDNAGSFDQLIPYLPTTFYYICMDLPGHGKSSHFPPSLPLHTINYIVALKMVLDYLNREKYVLIGHSWGGQQAMVFTQLYRQYVLKLIIIDVVYMYPISADYFKEYIGGRIDKIIEIYKKTTATAKRPSYTYDEALGRMMEGRMYGELKKEGAEAILKRALIPAENGKYRFTLDPRLRFFINALYGREFVNSLMRKYPIVCPVLIIVANGSIPSVEFFKSFIKEIQKSNSKCFVRTVTGNHDVHNNSPETVAPLVSNFLVYGSSKL